MTDIARLDTSADRSRFIFGGKAVFTVVSTGTGKRYTFKVTRKPGVLADDFGGVYFAKVLKGSDNWSNYEYTGVVFGADLDKLVAGRNGKPGEPSHKALAWLLRNLDSDQVEVWHEGKCGKCGRKLTVPESIETGFGPHCAAEMGG